MDTKGKREFTSLSAAPSGRMLTGPRPTPAADGSAPARVDQTIAWALQDAGVKVITHVPATGATALFDLYCQIIGSPPVYSLHEEVAYTIAHGASLSGARSAAIIKSHGLAKASNSVIDSLTLGTTAGLVAIVLDDPAGKHSDSIFAVDAFLTGTGIPFRTAGSDTAYHDLLECFSWSEALKTPVALLVDSELLSRDVRCSRGRLLPPEARYRRDPLRHVLCPPLAPYQRRVLEARLARAEWQSIPVPKLPPVPDGLPPAWRSAASLYAPLFEVFQELRPRIPFVSGDTGLSSLFAFAPFSCIDACSYYGGSLPLAIGFYLGSGGRPWAVTGDYAFLAAGRMGLIEALARRIPLKVLIMDNGSAATTGGQPIPAGVFERELNGWLPYVSRIDDPRDKEAVRGILERAIGSDRLEIVSVRFRASVL